MEQIGFKVETWEALIGLTPEEFHDLAKKAVAYAKKEEIVNPSPAFHLLKVELDHCEAERERLREKMSKLAKARWSKDKTAEPTPKAEPEVKAEKKTRAPKGCSRVKNPQGEVVEINWQGLLDQFNKVTGKKCRVVNSKAKRQFEARIREGYTKLDILHAVQNCMKSEWHKERNNAYLTLEFISRPDKIDAYVNAVNRNQE